MQLGAIFSPEDRNGMIIRALVPGMTFKVMATMDNGTPKEKRFILLDVKEGVAAFIVNSEISNFVSARPEMAKCQVHVELKSGMNFIDHDSYIDCFRVWTFPLDDIKDQLMQHIEWILGEIDNETRLKICEALRWSVSISPDDTSRYLAALGA